MWNKIKITVKIKAMSYGGGGRDFDTGSWCESVESWVVIGIGKHGA